MSAFVNIMKPHCVLAFLLASSTLRHLLLVSAQGLGVGGGGDIIASTICGPEDSRVRSFDLRQGRLMPMGCTAWLINESVFITAGHCGAPDENWRVHFTFDVDDAPEEDQYAVDLPSYASMLIPGDGETKDWGAGRLLPNSITGKLPGVAQTEKCGTFGCGWYSLGQVPSVGSDVTVTGYGILSEENPIPQPQQTKTGPVVAVTPISLRYLVDVMVSRHFTCSDYGFTCQHTNLMSLTKSLRFTSYSQGGDSGAPVLDYQTGKAIGIHTNSACHIPTKGFNYGTRIDLPELQQHISFLINTPSPTRRPTAKPTSKRPTHRPTRRLTAKPTPTM